MASKTPPKTPVTPAGEENYGIKLFRLDRRTVHVPIVGTSPLIMNKWSVKAKAEMLGAQTSRTRAKRDLKNPEADYLGSLWTLPDGSPGFPSVAFKAAIVSAARFFEGVTMVSLRPAVFVNGEGPDRLVRVEGSHRSREDMVRVGGKGPGTGTADVRFRAELPEWEALLQITYLPSLLPMESLVALVDAAGSSGIGEWRPSKSDTGSFGTWRVPEEVDFFDVKAADAA